jgi:hypothetical protein
MLASFSVTAGGGCRKEASAAPLKIRLGRT